MLVHARAASDPLRRSPAQWSPTSLTMETWCWFVLSIGGRNGRIANTTSVATSTSVWDGETYIHPYGLFCSQPCAVYYANNGEALHYHGKMFNHLADVQPISKEVYPDDDE